MGSELFEQTVGAVRRSDGAIPILLEVDSDREASSDQVQRRRRQNFYRRLGCRRIADCAYILPLPGDNAPPEMDLFVYVPGPARLFVAPNWSDGFNLIYRDVYGCSAGDRRIAIMLDRVSDPIDLA